jgi:hypothetical protein
MSLEQQSKGVNMKRSVIRTSEGFVVYGAFTCMMRLDTNGNVVYSNMKPDSKEHKAMLSTFKAYTK